MIGIKKQLNPNFRLIGLDWLEQDYLSLTTVLTWKAEILDCIIQLSNTFLNY